MRRSCMSFVSVAAFCCFAALLNHAQAQPFPTKPEKYDVTIRYRIVAGRNERIAEYMAMNRYLKSIGFVLDPNQDDDPRDPNETSLRGTLPSTADTNLFFRDPHIEALYLTPSGYQLPAEPNSPVKVQLQLPDGLALNMQRVFADQVRAKLLQLGFKEAVGYDHRGHTRILGLIIAAEIPTLLKDLRWQPSGWLAPEERRAQLPAPLRNISPIKVIEVLHEREGTEAPKGWGPAPDLISVDTKQKLSPELRDAAGKDETTGERVELFLSYSPGPGDDVWRTQLRRTAPSLVIEGRLGTMVTALVTSKDLLPLAQLPVVSGIRLPRPAISSLRSQPEKAGDNSTILRLSGVEKLHAAGHRGRGVRAAIVDGDFSGWEAFRGRELPAGVRYLDLTAERNPLLFSDTFAGVASEIGSGTQAALAFALAAPEAELTLIRIDPAALHQLDAVVRLIRGESFVSESMAQRNAELRADAEDLRRRRAELNEERTRVLNDFKQDDETNKRREQHFQNKAKLESDEKAWQQRQIRYYDLVEAENKLAGIQVVSSSLVWESGYPVTGDNPLSRLFSDAPPRDFFWFQSAGNSRGQTWAGLFQDVDGNGVMEFASERPGMQLWTRELNFLGWQSHGKESKRELPEKLRLRVSVQWREPHDPSVSVLPEDFYRRPLADVRLVLLRQRDPTAQDVRADEFDVVARSLGVPQRIDSQPTSATYEQVIEFPAELSRRYALRLEGRHPDGIRPLGVPSLPVQKEGWELWPRIHVEAVEAAARLEGSPILVDYPTELGGLGVPADAQGAITVSAANLSGEPQPYATIGPPLNRRLLRKPNVFAYDNVSLTGIGNVAIYGSDIAAPFAAGTSAAMLSSGIPMERWDWYLGQMCGQMLRAP